MNKVLKVHEQGKKETESQQAPQAQVQEQKQYDS